MFKICNDKTYYVVQTTSEDVVVEIYTKKDGRGSGISLHEMHLDLCRAIRKLQHDGYTIMKVYPAMGDRRESIDVLSMPEFIQSAKCPDNDVEEAVVFSYFESGATFQLPCKVNKKTHEIFDVTCAAMPCDDDCFSYLPMLLAEAKRNHIMVIAAGIGACRQSIHSEFPENFLDISDMNSMPRNICNIIKRKLVN